jgi:hypothetical protein
MLHSPHNESDKTHSPSLQKKRKVFGRSRASEFLEAFFASSAGSELDPVAHFSPLPARGGKSLTDFDDRVETVIA